jgi:hypothetical protein
MAALEASVVASVSMCVRKETERERNARLMYGELLHLARTLPLEAARRVQPLLGSAHVVAHDVRCAHAVLGENQCPSKYSCSEGLVCLGARGELLGARGELLALIRASDTVLCFDADGRVTQVSHGTLSARYEMMQTAQSMMLDIDVPDEMWALIFTFLRGVEDRRRARLVCRQWARAGRRDVVWEAFLPRDEWRRYPRGELMRYIPALAPNIAYCIRPTMQVRIHSAYTRKFFFWTLASLLRADSRSFEEPRRFDTTFLRGAMNGKCVCHRRFHFFCGEGAVTICVTSSAASESRAVRWTNDNVFRISESGYMSSCRSDDLFRKPQPGGIHPMFEGQLLLDWRPARDGASEYAAIEARASANPEPERGRMHKRKRGAEEV